MLGEILSGAIALHNQKKQNEFNAREAEKNRQFQREMQEQQNEYASSAAQLARLHEAGLNPNLALSSPAGQSPTGAPSGSTATSSPLSQLQPISPISELSELANAYSTVKQGQKFGTDKVGQEILNGINGITLEENKRAFEALVEDTYTDIFGRERTFWQFKQDIEDHKLYGESVMNFETYGALYNLFLRDELRPLIEESYKGTLSSQTFLNALHESQKNLNISEEDLNKVEKILLDAQSTSFSQSTQLYDMINSIENPFVRGVLNVIYGIIREINFSSSLSFPQRKPKK